MAYEIIFDIGSKGFFQMILENWMAWVIPGVMILAGVLLYASKGGEGYAGIWKHPWLKKIFAIFFISFCSIVMVIGDGVLIVNYFRLKNALESGKCKVVEGAITDFVPMPYEGHADEKITVAGVEFEYSEDIITSSYRTTVSHGGLLKEGTRVRIHYLTPELIAKVEIVK